MLRGARPVEAVLDQNARRTRAVRVPDRVTESRCRAAETAYYRRKRLATKLAASTDVEPPPLPPPACPPPCAAAAVADVIELGCYVIGGSSSSKGSA